MAIEVYKRLNYLNEITEKLAELDASEDAQRLTSFYGLTTKEICYKNLVKSFRWDKIKLKRCPRCHAHIDFSLGRQTASKQGEQQAGGERAKKDSTPIDLNDQGERLCKKKAANPNCSKRNFRVKRKRLQIRCSQCEFTKSFAIKSQYKTVYERLYADYLNDQKPS